MKKILLLIGFCILLFSGCSKEITVQEIKEDNTVINETIQEESTANESVQSGYNTMLLSTRNTDKIIEDKPSYQMDLTYDPDKQTIAGTETVTFKNTSSNEWNKVCFRDFPSNKSFQKSNNAAITKIDNIMIKYSSGNTISSTLTRDKKNNSIIYVTLAEPLMPEETISVSFDICVSIPERNDRFGYNKIGCNLGYFFPILSMYVDGKWENHPYYELGECTFTECSTFAVKVTAPEDYMIVTTGDLTKKDGNVSEFHADNVRDFTMVISNKYHVISKEYAGVTINSYYVDGDEEGGKVVLQAAADSIAVYNKTIGTYPYDSLDALEVLLTGAGGMEYPQLIMIDKNCYQSGKVTLQRVTAHETAHQWFYGIIGNDSYDEAWIDEGLATYLEIVYFEKVNPKLAKNLLKNSVSEEVYSSKESKFGLFDINNKVSDFSNDFSYVITVYNRAGEFLVTLRHVMGKEDFNSALQDIYTNYKFKITDTRSMLSIFQKNTEIDLSDIFDYYFSEEQDSISS